MSEPENTGPNQGGRFQPGQSGNPAGKPRGARHRTTQLAEKLMAEDAEAIVRKVVEAAKAGDLVAARLVLDRIHPPRKDHPVNFELPPIATAADAANAIGAVLAAVADGSLTPAEAGEVVKLIEALARTLEATEFEKRLRALEERQANGK